MDKTKFRIIKKKNQTGCTALWGVKCPKDCYLNAQLACNSLLNDPVRRDGHFHCPASDAPSCNPLPPSNLIVDAVFPECARPL